MIIRYGMQPAIAGLSIGLIGAMLLMQLLVSQLYEVKPTDPATFVLVACGIVSIAFVACIIPALRATKIDPLVALRQD